MHVLIEGHDMALSDEARKTIAEALRHGLSVAEVAAFFGVDRRTVFESMRRCADQQPHDQLNDNEEQKGRESGF